MKRKMYAVALLLCIASFCGSVFMVWYHWYQEKHAASRFEELVELVEESVETEPEEKIEDEEVQSPLDRYQELFERNHDMFGWISIEDTEINYPVMYTPDRKDFYLKRDFDQKYSAYGVPYIAEHCNPYEPSDNVILYGHHMNDGSMFSDLMKYESKKFYEDHKVISFDSLTKTAKYEVIAVFKTTVYDNSGFKYYLFTDAETEAEFNDYTKKCKELSLYETDVTAEYGDKLITLSTCEYSRKNGRMVIVAKKLAE